MCLFHSQHMTSHTDFINSLMLILYLNDLQTFLLLGENFKIFKYIMMIPDEAKL